MSIDYRLSLGADSGIYVRGHPQVQIWDHTNKKLFKKHQVYKGSGGFI